MKQQVTKVSIISVSAAIILAMSGCGGGGGDTAAPTTTTTTATTTSGTASDGYISGGKVCLDMNKNDQCDANATFTEPFALTDASGAYSLTITAAQKAAAQPNAPLLIEGGIDVDTQAPLVGALKAPFSGDTTVNTVLTPLTTLVSAMVENNVSVDTAYTKVAAALGIPADKVKADPVALAKEGDAEVLAAAMATHRIIQTMAAVDTTTDSNTLYGKLTDAIEQLASADTNTTKGIAAIVETAANDANSTLPESVKEAAKVATVIETQVTSLVTTAVENNASIEDAALTADTAVETVQTLVTTAIENNTTIDDNFIADVEDNATTTVASVNPVQLAVANVFTAYGMTTTAEDDNVTSTIANIFTSNSESSSDVTAESIIALSDTLGNPSYIEGTSVGWDGLRHYYRAQLVSQYVESRGYLFGDVHDADYIAELKNADGSYAFATDMSVSDFATMIYAAGENGNVTSLMTLALEMNPPANYASLSDVQKAKDLFTSIRTEVNSVSNSSLTGYADKESVKINTALNNVAKNVEFASTFLNGRVEDITTAMDANQTSISHSVGASGTRSVSLTQTSSSGTITWAYDMTQTNADNTVTHWTGTVSFPDIDPDTFDPSNFTTLQATLNGDLPLDYVPATTTGVEDKQTVALDATITKTTTGADLALSASISSNGDSLAITDASASVAYTTDATTGEPTATYIKLNRLYVKGTVGNYTLDGKLDVNAYTQNAIMAAAGGIEIETLHSWFGINAWCSNGRMDINNSNGDFAFIVDGKTYAPQWFDTGDTYLNMNYNIDANVTAADVNNTANYDFTFQCLNDNNETNATALNIDTYNGSWTDSEPNNSGYLPSDISFTGKLSNSADSSYFEGSVSAKWLDAADANLSAPEYEPNLQVSMSGALQMPESPLMSVTIAYDNSNGNVIDTTYVYDTLSVTSHNTFDATLDNGTINITASTGIQSTIKVVNGEIDYANSTLTTTEGKTLGTFSDVSGAPVIRYIDGSFESLP